MILTSKPAGSRRPPPASLTAALLLAGLLVTTLTLLFYRPAVIYSDTGDYMKMARLICAGVQPGESSSVQLRIVKGSDIPLNREFLLAGPKWKYPPGYPLLLSVPCLLLGPRGMFAAAPVMLFLALVVFNRLCGRFVGGRTALLAVLLPALVPSVVTSFLHGSSHLPMALLVLTALLFLDRWLASHRTRDAVLCGLATGLIPTVRYPEAAFSAVIGIAVLVAALRERRLRQLAAFCGSAAVPLLLLGAHLAASYGSPFRTGYAADLHDAFSVGTFLENLLPYARLVSCDLGTHVLLLATAGLVLLGTTPGRRTMAAVIALSVASSAALYLSWNWIAETRFLVPASFLVLLSAVVGLDRLMRLRPAAAVAIGIAVPLLGLIQAMPSMVLAYPAWELEGSSVRGAADLVLSRCGREEVVVADWRVCQDLDVTGDYILLDDARSRLGDPGEIREIARVGGDHRRFFLLAPPDIVRLTEWNLPAGYLLERLDTLKLEPAAASPAGVGADAVVLGSLDPCRLTGRGIRVLELAVVGPSEDPRPPDP